MDNPPTRTRPSRAGIAFVTLACLMMVAGASGAERGVPTINVYPAEIHHAGPQTFDITQDASGILYFGNLHGLLSWDGAWWRLLKLPDEQVALSVAGDAKGRVAIGMAGDLGYLAYGESGTPRVESLLAKLPPQRRDIGDVICICSTASGFLFVSEKSLILWDGGSPKVVKTFEADTAIRGCEADGKNVLVRGRNGLDWLDPATGAMTSAGIDARITTVIQRRDGSWVVVGRDSRLYSVTRAGAVAFGEEATRWLDGKLVVDGVELPDRRLILGTRQNGLVVLTPDGRIEQFVTFDSGLPDSVINDARLDRDGSLWIATDGPIVSLDLSSPVSLFDSRRGLRGSASDVARFQGRLYATTTHGVYTIDGDGNATRLPGLEDAGWRLLPVDDELLIGSDRAIYVLREGSSPQSIVKIEGEIYDMKRSATDPSRVWVAHGEGLGSLHRTEAGWRFSAVPGVPGDVSSVVEQEGTLWCGSMFNGVLRVMNPLSSAVRVTQFGSGEINATVIEGRAVFVRADGEILDLGSDGRLKPDDRLRHVKAPNGFFLAMQDARGDIWVNSTPPRVFRREGPSRWATEGVPLVGVTASDVQTMRVMPDGTLWFASDRGLFRFVRSVSTEAAPAQPPPVIRRVVAGASRVIFDGAPSGQARPPELRHDFGRLRVEFAPATFRPGVVYQYRLDPVDTEWSDWTDQSFIDYTNLAENDYVFRLRARGAAMRPSSETRWRFTVLAPWYRTRLAVAIWTLLAFALVAGVIAFRTRRLHRKADRLRVLVDHRTAELQRTVGLLESANARLEILSMEDELTAIANRRFFERALADEWNRARRLEQPLALILLDLDHFKQLNDRRGHPAGDECLRRVGAALSSCVKRSGEVVARYGGEEFAILLPATDGATALRIAETLRARIQALEIIYGGTSTRCLSASCGVASFVPRDGLSAEDLVARADAALYAAKQSGRDCTKASEVAVRGFWSGGGQA